MKKTFLAAVAFSVVFAFAAEVGAQQNGWVSRYWDGCKPSCAWPGKPGPGGTCKSCSRENNILNDANARNACEVGGGTAYTCWDMIPFRDPNDPNKAYAFAATPNDQCGACYEITFNGGFQHGSANSTHQAIKGKVLIVMASNMGGDVESGQFDVLVPGGGVGAFDAFSNQIGVSKDKLGVQYGGLLADGCANNPSNAKKCLQDKCNSIFTNALLKEGCNFYADWFEAANNPTMTYKTVTCPTYLTDRYKTGSNTPTPGGGGNPTPTPTTYTLTVTKSHDGAGTTTPASSQSNISAGTSVNLSTTVNNGYTFTNWTVTNGNATINNANNATGASVTVNGNITVRANFTQNPSTYTLTVNRNPTAGGTTTPASNQSNITAGTQVDISATAATGYTFSNWTISGSGTLANANSASTKVTVNGNVTVTANYKLPDGTVPTPPAGGGGDTIKVEAENYTSKNGDIKTNTANGITNIGYIENGHSATYNNVNATAAGDYVMQFRIAAGTDIASYSFTVSVNGQNAGTVSGNNTGSWDTYVTMTLNSKVKLNAGNNTIVLNFQSAVNVDYFLLIGDAPPVYTLTVNRNPATGGTVKVNGADYSAPVKVNGGVATPIAAAPADGYVFKNWTAGSGATIAAANSAVTNVTVSANATVTANFEQITIGVRYNPVNGRTQIALKPASRGFTALLPVGHGFTAYKVIDLQGREVRSGRIGASAADLSVSGLKHSVVFLKLEGNGRSPLSLKVVTY